MHTNFVGANFLNTTRSPGHPGKTPGTSQIPLFETQGRQTFEGGHELFGHRPFAWKTPTPPGGLQTWDTAHPLEESPKESSGAFRPGVQKVSETVSEESPESQNSLF